MALLALLACASSRTATAEPPQPFFDAGKHQVEYHGPGRDAPTPEAIEEIRIAYFGPTDPQDPNGHMWPAAQAAVTEANRQGGCQGKPFRILPAWSKDPWGGGIKQLARLVYVERVWAVVSGVDGATAHLAEQLAAKARFPVVNAVSTDKTVNLANVPWVFSLAPGDHLLCPVLAAAIAEHAAEGPITVVSADGHDARQFNRQLTRALKPHYVTPSYLYQFRSGNTTLTRLTAEVVRTQPSAVVIVAGAEDSARMVTDLRERGFSGTIFGGPTMGRRRFLEQAGNAADGVVFPMVQSPESRARSPEMRVGNGASKARRQDLPLSLDTGVSTLDSGLSALDSGLSALDSDYAAALAHDAVHLLVDAIEVAGLNRARIRDAMAELSPWEGTAGIVRWDGLGRNTRGVSLGTVVRGRVGTLPRPSSVAP